MHLISLVGEQPLPILLPDLYLKPDEHLLVHTHKTEAQGRRLQNLLPNSRLLRLPAYDLDAARAILRENARRDEQHFNLTGGTKLMALAAFSLAAENQQPVLYLKSEACQNVLYRYQFEHQTFRAQPPETLPSLLNLDQYLHAHLPGYREEGFHTDEDGQISIGGQFEKALYQALESELDEVKAGVRPEGVADQLEIDLIVRLGNQVGIIEAKTGPHPRPKTGVDQLTTAGSRKYLGTYTHRFLVLGSPLHRKVKTLATENDIHVIELPGYRQGSLPGQERHRLVNRVIEKMRPPFQRTL